MYDKSVEEQRYEASIAREKKAFENLIGYKANMVIPLDVPGSVDVRKHNSCYFRNFC